MPPITKQVLHVALEYGDATLGGLGTVATQMVEAQNEFKSDNAIKFNACIITPYYKKIYINYNVRRLIATVSHLYNNVVTTSNIYLAADDLSAHYLVEPSEEHKILFEIDSINGIYNDNEASLYIERLKYFNSAVAAYANIYNPDILLLHDWQAALVPKLLGDLYKNEQVKSIFIVHVSNIDYGGYAAQQLQGLGLNFSSNWQILKAIGLKYSEKIVAVSESFLQECTSLRTNDPNVELLRRHFALSTISGKATYILNGFNYKKFSPLGYLINDTSNIYLSKLKLKFKLADLLRTWFSTWRINPYLPVFFYIGRFSEEKGVRTFAQLIKTIKNKAIFFALGRGLTDSVYEVIQKHSKKTDNVFISYDEEDQKKYKSLMRACADFTFVCSRQESFGLATKEGFANGALCVTSGVGGLKDSVSPLKYADKDNTSGNGFIYNNQACDDSDNPYLTDTINESLTFWASLNPAQKNSIHLRLMDEAKSSDWAAKNGPLSKYISTFEEVLDTTSPEKGQAYKLRQ